MSAFKWKGSFLFLAVWFYGKNAAQNVTLDWMKQYGNTGQRVYAKDMALDSGKFIIVTGSFNGTVDFDPGPGVSPLTSNGDFDVYVAKYDTSGNFIWAKSIGSTPGEDVKGLVVTSTGDIIFMGFFQSTIDMDPAAGTVIVNNQLGVNTIINKLDANGNLVWTKQLLMANCSALSIDKWDNIFIGGDYSGTYDFDPGTGVFNMTAGSVLDADIFLLKLNKDGNFLWARGIPNGGGTQVTEQAIINDELGNVFLTGSITGSMDFDPGPGVVNLNTLGGRDCYLVSLDSAGSFRWAKSWGGTGAADLPWDVKTDAGGAVYITGQFGETVDFDPGAGVFSFNATAFRNCFLLKLNADGSFGFAKQFTGTSFGQSLSLDPSGNIYIAGGFFGPADFDPGPGDFTINGGDIFVTRLDPSGNLYWAAAFQTQIVGSYESIYVHLATDVLKNVYYAGFLPMPVDFDPSAGTYTASPAGINDVALVKLFGQCRVNGPVLNITNCDEYTLNGITYNTSGSYTQMLNGSNGCDSVVTLNLTITQTVTQAQASSCGDYTWNGNIYTTSGTYRDTLTTTIGCDSIIVLDLTINQKPTPQLGNNFSICENETALLYPGNFEVYLWNTGASTDSLSIGTTGTYWVTVTNNGCSATDSISITDKAGCISGDKCGISDATVFYPLPCRDKLYVNKNTTSCSVYLNLYNAIGQLMLKNYLLADGLNSIDMKRFATGAYFYTMHNGSTILKRGKIVKD